MLFLHCGIRSLCWKWRIENLWSWITVIGCWIEICGEWYQSWANLLTKIQCRRCLQHWMCCDILPKKIFLQWKYWRSQTGIEVCIYLLTYRVIQVKVDETKQLFQIENMDRFLIKWYFHYCKGREFFMVPKKFRKKNLARHSNSLSDS